MKNWLPWFLAVFVVTNSICGAQNTILSSKKTTGWTVNRPFEHHVFIENKGQFVNDQKTISDPILYYNRLGKTAIYFCASSITFRYDSVTQTDAGADDDKLTDGDLKKNGIASPQFLKMAWLNANPDVQVEVQQPESDYFSYPDPVAKSGNLSIRAHAWKKLIYHNIYNNIDIEFYYPDKGGIEYNIIVHPGANAADVQMAYSANARITLRGSDAQISCAGINLTDHAPSARDEEGNAVLTSFVLNDNTLSFKISGYDKAQTLTIDPWITATNFFVYNVAYDVNYDNDGNVYIAGGQSPYELMQFDSSGNPIWTFTASEYEGGLGYYGSFTTDVRSGSSYFVRGLGALNTYLNVLKIDNQSNLVVQDSDPNPGYVEYWRVAFDYANNQLVIAAGEDYNAALIDTNLTSVKDIALLNPAYTHDMCMLALDGQGNAYMASNKTFFEDTNYFNNEIFKYSLPSLTSALFTVKDHYEFTELISLTFYPEQMNGVAAYANGYNGLAANKNMVVSYNGASLRKYKTTNGAMEDSIKISGQDFLWSGIDLDCEGNIYVGDNTNIIVLDSGFNRLDTLPLSNRVFGVKVGNGRLYACGYDFVQSINIPANASIVISAKARPAAYCVGGSATLTAYGGTNYTWSPSVGLSATTGTTVIANPAVTTTYTINGVNNGGCPGATTSTVVVTVEPALSVNVPSPSPICAGDSVTLTATGGATDYTWSPSANLNATSGTSVIADPVATTTYTVIGTNNTCADTAQAIVTINPSPVITIQPPSAVLCSGLSDTLTAGGGTTYSWSPSTGLSAITGSSVLANPTASVTYTVSSTGVNGCPGTGTAVLTVVLSPNTPTFHQHGDTLISSSTKDNTWYRNGVLLSDTGQYLVITETGEYWVIVNNEANGCSAASDSADITQVTGIEQLSINNDRLSVYPNPFSEQLTIISPPTGGPIDEVDITDELGQILLSDPIGGYKDDIDMSRFPNGMYFMTVVNKTSRMVVPVVKQ